MKATEKEVFIQKRRGEIQRAVAMEQAGIEQSLEWIIDMATKALDRLQKTGTVNKFDSNVKGIGSTYESLIESIERRNTLKQIIDFVLADESK
jgi:hypothetical protein